MSDLAFDKHRTTTTSDRGGVGNSTTDSRRVRIMAGLERAKGRGIRLGRPRILIDMNRVLALQADGRSLGAIGRALGVSAMTVSRTLANAGPAATVATKIIDGRRAQKIEDANRRFLARREDINESQNHCGFEAARGGALKPPTCGDPSDGPAPAGAKAMPSLTPEVAHEAIPGGEHFACRCGAWYGTERGRRVHLSRELTWLPVEKFRALVTQAGFTARYEEPEGWPASAGET